LLVVAVVSLAALYISQKRRRRPTNNNNNNTTTTVQISHEQLQQFFQQAAESSRQLTNLAHGDQLLLYGLYKQATVGDCKEELEPSRFHVIGHAKYEGWLKFKGMPCEAAMRSYIQVVLEFNNAKGDLEYETQELDMLNAMGVRPSTLAGKEEEFEKDMSTATPLVQAAQSGNLQQVQLIALDKHVDTVNTTDDSGQTALHFAADRGYYQVVETLLDAGANANAADLEGISVLQAAVIAGHADVACLLLKHGANPHQSDMDGDTPLSCARDDGSDEMKQLFGVASQDDSIELEA